MMVSDEFFHAQEAELNRLVDQRVIRMIRMLERARKDLRGEISDLPEGFNRRQVLQRIKQVEAILDDLNLRITQFEPSDKPLAELIAKHVPASVQAIAAVQIEIPFGIINTDILAAMSENGLEMVSNKVCQQAKERLRLELFRRVGIKGENPAAVAKDLCGPDGFFGRSYGHVENIMRTEASTIYNAQGFNALEHANAELDLGLHRRVVETIDDKRNNPISQVLNGQVIPTSRQVGFKAKASAVQAVARRIKRSTAGIFWKQADGYYVGHNLPAHYRERGIVVPTDRPITPI